MSPVELLAALAAQNVRVMVAGDKLKLRAPGRIAPELVAQVRNHKQNIIAVLAPPSPAPLTGTPEQEALDLLAVGHPAYSIITTCQRFGVALTIDSDGTLIIGRAGAKAEEPTQPWPSLLIAIEAHLEAVAVLVNSGWGLRATFPSGEAA
jgi:TubC N-terminal docking domain